MTEHSRKAVELFRSGYNCSQAVFAAFSDVTGIDEKTSVKMASPFGGGLGRLREICGAVSGMSLAAGCLWGYDDTKNKDAKTEHYALISGMAKDFAEVFGSYICKDILAIKTTEYSPVAENRTPEFYALRPCERCVAVAAEILDKRIEQTEK